MTGIESIELGYVPKSLNRIRGGNQGRGSVMKQHRIKLALQNDLWALIQASKLPKGCELIEARARLRFPVRRERDEGNFRSTLEKALGDALQLAKVIDVDTPDRYRFRDLEFDPEPGPPRTLVIFTYRT